MDVLVLRVVRGSYVILLSFVAVPWYTVSVTHPLHRVRKGVHHIDTSHFRAVRHGKRGRSLRLQMLRRDLHANPG